MIIVAREAPDTYSVDVLRQTGIALRDVAPGEVRLRTIYLSLDPTHFNWLKLGRSKFLRDSLGFDLGMGDPMMGPFIGIVEESRSVGFHPGQIVAGFGPWQRDIVMPATALKPINLAPGEPLTAYLTIFSHIGLAAYSGVYGVLDVQQYQTILVSGAAGATGSVAIELCVAAGARVVGIAGSREKCEKIRELGATEAINYRQGDIAAEISRTCPDGIDGFFDNVGGPTLDAAISNMKSNGRVAICGIMSDYNRPFDQVHGVRNMYQLLIRSVRLQGFIAGQVGPAPELQIAALRKLFWEGKVGNRPHVVAGIENAAAALAMLYRGANSGKLILQVSAPPVE